jgi:hypothetical protein
MKLKPGWSGKRIEELVGPCFNAQNLPPGYEYNRKYVMDKVNAWNQQAKKKKESETKRLLIG